MYDFSDDKVFARGGYGPRIRHFNGAIIDYKITETLNATNAGIDQLRYIVECFREESSTRRAIISLGDVMKDNFDAEGGNVIYKHQVFCDKCGLELKMDWDTNY